MLKALNSFSKSILPIKRDEQFGVMAPASKSLRINKSKEEKKCKIFY